MVAWIDWLKAHGRGTGTVGGCFGGGWSLNGSLARPVDATVVYYGRVNKSADQIAPLASPLLGHFATEDQFINRTMVAGFEAAMKSAGKTYEVHWYEASHGVANPTSARHAAAAPVAGETLDDVIHGYRECRPGPWRPDDGR